MKALSDWLKWRIAGPELEELQRWRIHCDEYKRWLAEFPEVKLVLTNLQHQVGGEVCLDVCHPPGSVGPWVIDGLRERLRQGNHRLPLVIPQPRGSRGF